MTCEFPGCTNSTGVTAYCIECKKRVKPNVGSACYAIPPQGNSKELALTTLQLENEYWTLLADRIHD